MNGNGARDLLDGEGSKYAAAIALVMAARAN